MVEDGELDPEKAETSRFANMLWNAVGGDSSVTPELAVRSLKSGDALLVCSDGLTGHLSDGAILHLVDSKGSAEEACEALVGTVTGIGGHDDVTVALARFEQEVQTSAPGAAAPTPDSTAAAAQIPKGVAQASNAKPAVADGANTTARPLRA